MRSIIQPSLARTPPISGIILEAIQAAQVDRQRVSLSAGVKTFGTCLRKDGSNVANALEIDQALLSTTLARSMSRRGWAVTAFVS